MLYGVISVQSGGIVASSDRTIMTLFLCRLRKSTCGGPLGNIIRINGPRRCWMGCVQKTNRRIYGRGGLHQRDAVAETAGASVGPPQVAAGLNSTISARDRRARLLWTVTRGPRHGREYAAGECYLPLRWSWRAICWSDPEWDLKSTWGYGDTLTSLDSLTCRVSATRYAGRGHWWGAWPAVEPAIFGLNGKLGAGRDVKGYPRVMLATGGLLNMPNPGWGHAVHLALAAVGLRAC